ncbi:MAG: aminomethyl transferase family protein [Anaerolineaceae bacterium]|nr:aminomethyl transferase family protein [Anaerolineaceae bacterium]
MTGFHLAHGAVLAKDGIPLHYGDLGAEYHAALEKAVVMDRSHEGRLHIAGDDRVDWLQRIATNDLMDLPAHTGRPTLFTNANGRVIHRAVIYNRGDWLLAVTEPGQGGAFQTSLQRQVFYNDRVHFVDLTATTRQFVLHGPESDQIADALLPGAAAFTSFHGAEVTVAGVPVFMVRRKPVSGAHWLLVTPSEMAEQVWAALLKVGAAYSLIPAGSLTYNAIRIRAGRPAIGHELTANYIPLELGLWDEVSFGKGCYTGQEILARMESRQRLAKTIVTLRLDAMAEAPVELTYEGKPAGMLTSSVVTPLGEILGIGVVKLPLAVPGQSLMADGSVVHILGLPGVQSL